MANSFSNNPAPFTPQRYPMVLRKGDHPNVVSRVANNAEEEALLVADGFGTKLPPLPEPEPEKPVLTMEERVSALEEQMADWRQKYSEAVETVAAAEQPKRGPGRPRRSPEETNAG